MEASEQKPEADRPQVREDEDVGWLGKDCRWRTTRVMQKLCVLVCKLMVMEPIPGLFKYDTCENQEGGLPAVCADGIWAGYLKNSRKNLRML